MKITAAQEGKGYSTNSRPVWQDQAIGLLDGAARAKFWRRAAWIAQDNDVAVSPVMVIAFFVCKGVSIHEKGTKVWLVVGEDFSG